MTAPGAAVRAAAARVVAETLAGHSLKTTLTPELASFADARDRALVEAICFETLRWKRRYDAALDRWMPRPLPARDARLAALIRVGLAQIDALRLPDHASVAATVEAARLIGRPNAVGLVNAVLRRALREGMPESADPAVTSSHPDWLVAALANDWPDHWRRILDANNRPAPVWLRVNRRRSDPARYASRLEQAGIGHRRPDGFPDALILDQGGDPTSLPGWAEGEVSVQDGAAQSTVELLPLAAGMRVLDACAAPGGKAAHLLERVPGLRLTVLDWDRRRLVRVRETLARLHLPAPEAVRVADAGDPATWWDGQPFDAILLDAPCSATGVIRRQPDIKWHRRASDLADLVAGQARLLDALWPLLRPAGHLLYATCSLLATENADQIAAFLGRHDDALVLDLPDRFGHAAGAGRQRLPGEFDCDGFFYALLQRAGADDGGVG